MVKIGRNAPCPCGSGKKYKKCCLPKEDQAKAEEKAKRAAKDRERAMREEQEQKELDELFEDVDDFYDEDYDEHFNEDFEDLEIPPQNVEYDDPEEPAADESLERQSDPVPSEGPPDTPLPKIGAAETGLVEQWWTLYSAMKDIDQIRAHLEQFMENHPELVRHLELQHAALFEMGAKYVALQRHGEYAALLQHLREAFEDTYVKRFGVYDYHLVAYQVMTANREAIGRYLNHFRKYPDHDPGRLFQLIDLLMATGCEAQVTDLVEDIYLRVLRSPQIVGGDQILAPVVMARMAPFLRPDFTEASLAKLAARMQALDEVMPGHNTFTVKRFGQLFDQIFHNRRSWDVADCISRRDLNDRYYHVSLDFMRFLHENDGLGWVAAAFYRGLVHTYLLKVIPEGKRPREAFVFTRLMIEQTVFQTTRDLFSIDSTRALGMLRGLHAFARYLQLTQTLADDRCIAIQGWCRELYEEYHQMLVRRSFAAKVFEETLP